MTGPSLRGCRAQCTVCGEYFGSDRAFDRHRLGDFAKTGEWRHDRRCLTAAEMDAAGWAWNGRGFLLAPDPRRAGAGVHGPCANPPARGVAGATHGR